MQRFMLILTIHMAAVSFAFASGKNEIIPIKELDVGGLKGLRVEAYSYDIVLKSGGERALGVVYGDPRDEVDVTTEGTTLVIAVRPQVLFQWTPGRIELTVPEETRLDLKSISGELRLKGLFSGRVSAQSVSGSLTAESLMGRGTLSTVSGTLSAKEIQGDWGFRSVSGALSITNFDGGRLNVENTSGSIKLKNVAVSGSADLSSVSGSITGKFVGNRYEFRLSSVSGALSVDGEEGEKKLAAGDGDILVEAHTISGRIDLD